MAACLNNGDLFSGSFDFAEKNWFSEFWLACEIGLGCPEFSPI